MANPNNNVTFTGNKDSVNPGVDPESISDLIPNSIIFNFYKFNSKVFRPGNGDKLSDWVSNKTRMTLNKTQIGSLSGITYDQKSGNPPDYITQLQVSDKTGNVATFVNGESIKIAISDGSASSRRRRRMLQSSAIQPSIKGTSIYPFKSGSLELYQNLIFLGEPITNAHIDIETNEASLLADAGIKINYELNVYFKDCEVGDIFNEKSHTCDTCPSGSYSFSNPRDPLAICEKCENTKS